MKRFSNCVSWTKGFVGGIWISIFVVLAFAFYKTMDDPIFANKIKEAAGRL